VRLYEQASSLSGVPERKMTSRWVHRFACLLVVATFLLIIAGASVTSNRAGLAVPDWPTTYGQFMYSFPFSKMVGGIFYEHGHRLLASAVGFMTIVLTVWIVRVERRRWVRRLAIAALGTVIAQGILGGLTVKFFLRPPISIAHASLAEAFFCTTIALAMFTSPQWVGPAAPGTPTGWLTLATTIVVYVQVLLGASIRHSDLGFIAHIVGAVVVVALAATLVRERTFRGQSISLFALVVVQVGLGIATLLVRLPKDAVGQLSSVQILLPTIHLAVGALILATSVSLTLRSCRFVDLPIGAFVELVKPRIVSMVLVTTCLGYFLGARGTHSWLLLLVTLLGVGCSAGGSAVLNNYLERDVDSKMSRTRHRALPAGLVEPAHALAFGVCLVLAGSLTLVRWVNLLTGFLVLLAAFLYVLVYTPMKRWSWINTTLGAIPGAIPPLCGWAAASGRLDVGAWVLFAILFAWQHPHFYSIAWMFKDDYRAAGLKMLPVVDPDGVSTFRQTVAYSVALIGASLLPTVIGMTGQFYFYGALLIGLTMLGAAVCFARQHGAADARRLLRASILYLPLLLLLIALDAG